MDTNRAALLKMFFLQSTPFWEEHGRTELRMLSVLIRDF